MAIEALCLPAFTSSRARDTPGFVFERMLHSSINGLMVVVAFVREAASRGQMMSVAKLLVCNTILETVNL